MPLSFNQSSAGLRRQLELARAHAASSEAAASAAEAAANQAIEALRNAARAQEAEQRYQPDSSQAASVVGAGEEIWGRDSEVRLDAHGTPSLESVPAICARLESNSAAVRADGALMLGRLVESVAGREALMLGECVSES